MNRAATTPKAKLISGGRRREEDENGADAGSAGRIYAALEKVAKISVADHRQ